MFGEQFFTLIFMDIHFERRPFPVKSCLLRKSAGDSLQLSES